MKRERDGRRVEDNDCSISEKGLVFDEEEAEDDGCEEEDVSALSGLDNYQLCLKYQQVLCSTRRFSLDSYSKTKRNAESLRPFL